MILVYEYVENMHTVGGTVEDNTSDNIVVVEHDATVELFSERALLSFEDRIVDRGVNDLTALTALASVTGNTIVADNDTSATVSQFENINFIVIDFPNGVDDLRDSLIDSESATGHNFINYNVESFGANLESIEVLLSEHDELTHTQTITGEGKSLNDQSGYISYIPLFTDVDDDRITNGLFDAELNSVDMVQLKLNFVGTIDVVYEESHSYPIVLDFFSFGFENDGEASDERIANQIIRILLEESGSNTASLEGTLEYIMINQLNIDDIETYAGLTTVGLDVSFIVIEDLTGSSAPSVTYLDRDTTNSQVQVSALEDAPSHTGVVSLDVESFKAGDTVTVTLEDLDLNVDSGLVDIYTVVDTDDDDVNQDAVGEPYGASEYDGVELGRLLDITFDDQRWQNYGNTCAGELDDASSLSDTNFSLTETGDATGIFVGTFPLPTEFCRDGDEATPESITGVDIEVNYVDFRDQSGETTEVGDSAGVKASTGSVSFDRTVYPVPFGIRGDFETTTSTTPSQNNNVGRSLFPIHQSGMSDDPLRGLDSGEFLPQGDLIVYVTVTDPDYDVSASGQDSIAEENAPVTVTIIRGSDREMVAEIGGTNSPIDEIAPDAGIFESSVTIRYNDGPESSICPDTPISAVFNDEARY